MWQVTVAPNGNRPQLKKRVIELELVLSGERDSAQLGLSTIRYERTSATMLISNHFFTAATANQSASKPRYVFEKFLRRAVFGWF